MLGKKYSQQKWLKQSFANLLDLYSEIYWASCGKKDAYKVMLHKFSIIRNFVRNSVARNSDIAALECTGCRWMFQRILNLYYQAGYITGSSGQKAITLNVEVNSSSELCIVSLSALVATAGHIHIPQPSEETIFLLTQLPGPWHSSKAFYKSCCWWKFQYSLSLLITQQSLHN